MIQALSIWEELKFIIKVLIKSYVTNYLSEKCKKSSKRVPVRIKVFGLLPKEMWCDF